MIDPTILVNLGAGGFTAVAASTVRWGTPGFRRAFGLTGVLGAVLFAVVLASLAVRLEAWTSFVLGGLLLGTYMSAGDARPTTTEGAVGLLGGIAAAAASTALAMTHQWWYPVAGIITVAVAFFVTSAWRMAIQGEGSR